MNKIVLKSVYKFLMKDETHVDLAKRVDGWCKSI